MSVVRTDPRIALLNQTLASRSEAVVEDRSSDADRIEAAVALVVRARARMDFLLIKRAASERDPWSGQMALPGGRWERSDRDLQRTAVRETLEETGLDLDRKGIHLGRLAEVRPASARLPRMRIAPFVFAVPADTEATVASAELQSVHWVPLDALHRSEAQASIEIDVGGIARSFPSYAVVGEHVWGLTHRILTDFLSAYPNGSMGGVQGS